MSDDGKREALASWAVGSALVALLVLVSFGPERSVDGVRISAATFGAMMGIGCACLLAARHGRRAWRACVVALMVPLTLWNRAHDMNGKAYGPSEIATLASMSIPNLMLCTVAAIVAERHGYALTPYAWVWAAWPIWILVYGVAMRVGAWAVGRLRSAYAETEAELYGRAADDGDERRGGLTEVDRG